MADNISIRPGRKEDIPAVLQLIKELAIYEKAPLEVVVSEEDMINFGFGEKPLFELIVATSDQTIIGISLFYVRYSTWKGPMLYLEDLVVNEQFRGKGIGHLLFEETMKIAAKNNYAGMVWQVLDWNQPAINFYNKYSASFDAEWLNGKLSKNQIIDFFKQK